MKFKRLRFSSVFASAVLLGPILSATPAHALSLNGTFNFGGDVNITGSSSNYQFDFLTAGDDTLTPGVAGDIDVRNSTGSFNNSGEVAGGAKITDFSTNFSSPNFPASPVEGFIKGIRLSSGKVLSFDLDSFADFAFVFTPPGGDGVGFNGGALTGVFRDASGTAAGKGAITAQFPDPVLSGKTNYSFSLKAEPVPTPALLPGLAGMGVAVLRKRKAEEEESVEG